MKCPNCNAQMEKGFLSKDNVQWVTVDSMAGSIKSLLTFATYGLPFFAYHCAACGKIELTTTDHAQSK